MEQCKKDLIKAVTSNNIEEVKRMIGNKENSINLNEVFMNKQRVVNLAIILNHIEMVRFLVSNGANISKRDSGSCPLLLAVRFGHIGMAEMLIDLGADIEEGWVEEMEKISPLIYCCHYSITNNFETLFLMAKMLIDKGADVNAQDCYGKTSLHHLALNQGRYTEKEKQRNHETLLVNIAKLLFCNGANIHVEDLHGDTAQHFAILRERLELGMLFIREGAKVKGTMNGTQAWDLLMFHTAVVRCPEFTRLCLERGSDFNFYTKHSVTAYNACLYHGTQTTKVFWEFGCPIDQTDRSVLFRGNKKCKLPGFNNHISKTLLKIQERFIDGIRKNSLTKVIKALKEGAEPKGCSMEIPSTLHFVVEKGNLGLTKLLLEKGIPPNLLNDKNETPLCIAIKKGNVKMSKVLLQFGACYNQNVVSEYFSEIIDSKENEVSRLFKTIHISFKLAEKGDLRVLVVLKKYISREDMEMVSVLMNCINRSGLTLMGMSLAKGHVEIASTLMNVRIVNL